MDILELTIDGDPIPKGRPRFDGRSKRTYTPARTVAAEKDLKLQVAEIVEEPVESPVHVRAHFDCATHRRTDLDNLVKLVSDAFNGIVFADDHQVHSVYATLRRGQKADACTYVRIRTLDQGVDKGAEGVDVILSPAALAALAYLLEQTQEGQDAVVSAALEAYAAQQHEAAA